MIAIEQTQQQLRERAQQIQQAEQQVQAFNPSLEAMRTQRFLRVAPQGGSIMTQQVRLKEQERLRTIAKTEAEQQVEQFKQQQEQYETEFRDYLNSDAGKMQYVKEKGLTPVSYEQKKILTFNKDGEKEHYNVTIPVYETPYGKVRDETPYYKQLKNEEELQAREFGYKDASELQKVMEMFHGVTIKTPSGFEIDTKQGTISMPTLDNVKVTTDINGNILVPLSNVFTNQDTQISQAGKLDISTLIIPPKSNINIQPPPPNLAFQKFIQEGGSRYATPQEGVQLLKEAVGQPMLNQNKSLVQKLEMFGIRPSETILNIISPPTIQPPPPNLAFQKLIQEGGSRYATPQEGVQLLKEAVGQPMLNQNKSLVEKLLLGNQNTDLSLISVNPLVFSKEILRQVETGAEILAQRTLTAIQKVAPSYEGVSYTVPKQIVPTKSTLIDYGQSTQRGQFDIPEKTIKLFTPEGIGKTFSFVSTAPLYLNPYTGSVLLLGGATRGAEKVYSLLKYPQSRIGGKTELYSSIAETALNLAFLTGGALSKVVKPKYSIYRQAYTPPKTKLIDEALLSKNPFIIITKPSANAESSALIRELYPFATIGREVFPGYKTTFEKENIFAKLGITEPKQMSRAEIKNLLESGETSLGKLRKPQIDEFISSRRPFVLNTAGSGAINVAYGGSLKGPMLLSQGQVFQQKVNFNLREGVWVPSPTRVTGFKVTQPAEFYGEAKGFERYKSYPIMEKFYLPKKSASSVFKEGYFDIYGRYNYPKGAYMKVSQAGKTKQAFEQLSGVKKIGTGFRAISKKSVVPADFYTDFSLSRKFPAGRKKYPDVSKLTILKIPLKDIKVEFATPSIRYRVLSTPTPKVISTPQSDLYQTLKSIYGKQVASETKSLMKTMVVKVPKTTRAKTSQIQDILSPPKVSPSMFYGKGMYERTAGGLLPGELGRVRGTQMKLTNIRMDNRINIDEKNSIREITQLDNRVTTDLDNKLGNRFKLDNRIITNERNSMREETKIDNRIISRVGVKLDTKLDTELTTKIIPRIKQPQQEVPRPPKPPRPRRVPNILLPEQNIKYNAKKVKSSRAKYIAEVRRFRKYSPIGEFSTPELAIEAAKTEVRRGLGASLRIKTPKGFLPVAPSQEFRVGGKRNPFALVQRASARITSFGEKSEIQRFRNLAKFRTPKFKVKL